MPAEIVADAGVVLGCELVGGWRVSFHVAVLVGVGDRDGHTWSRQVCSWVSISAMVFYEAVTKSVEVGSR